MEDCLTALTSNILLNDTKFANSVSKVGDELIYTSNEGSIVEKPFNLFIKTKVVYGWGVAEEWVTIRVKPAKDLSK